MGNSEVYIHTKPNGDKTQLYRIVDSAGMFHAWKRLETEYGVHLFSALFQNNSFIPVDELNNEFNRVWVIINEELTKMYTEAKLEDLKLAYTKAGKFINSINETPVTVDEYNSLSNGSN